MHIQGRAGKLATLQGCQQRVVIDQATSRRVD